MISVSAHEGRSTLFSGEALVCSHNWGSSHASVAVRQLHDHQLVLSRAKMPFSSLFAIASGS